MPSFIKRRASARSCDMRDSLTPSSSAIVLHRTLFEEVADHDVTQALGQSLDRVHEVRLALAVEDRVLGAAVGGREERLGVAFDDERVVVQDRGAVDVVDELVHDFERNVELARHLFGRRGAAELARELLVRGLEATGTGPDRAAGPVPPAELVEQRAADAGGREPVEGDAPLRIEAPGRLGQAEHAGRHEVAAAHVTRNPMCDLRCDILDERQVLPDQLVLVCRPLDVDVLRLQR